MDRFRIATQFTQRMAATLTKEANQARLNYFYSNIASY